LGAVILLIYGLAYLLKNHYRPLTMTKHLKAVAWLSVGQRERIAIIQAGNKQYLIGITAEQITAIDSIDPPIQDDVVTPFADHLPSWWKKKS
jgi:flagellar protein FliO/FliZ